MASPELIDTCPACGAEYAEEGAIEDMDRPIGQSATRWVRTCLECTPEDGPPVNWDAHTGELIPGWL